MRYREALARFTQGKKGGVSFDPKAATGGLRVVAG